MTQPIGAGPRTTRRTVGGRTVWRKRFDRPSPPKWHRLQRFAFLVTRNAVFKAVPSPDGPDGMRQEIETMRRFREIGVRVPEIVRTQETMIEMTDIGETLRALEGKGGEGAIAGAVVGAASELARIHGRGLVHGRPILRNLTWDGSSIGFIDFEEELLAVMPLAAAQARDILLLLMSVGRRNSGALVDEVFAAYADRMPAAVAAELRRVYRLARPLTGLPGRILMRSGNLDIAGAVRAVSAMTAHLR
jgi:tRNA A-37 threonylcarbamoyl transferase component Bud32